MSSHINEWPSLKDTPEYQKKLDERVKKIEQDEKNYNHLVKVNDVLNVLDVTDEQEDMLRPRLETLDNEVLKSLTTKTRWEIFAILENTQNNENQIELKNNKEKTELADSKISKLQSIFTPELLNNNPDIKNNFEALELAKTPEEKEAILQGIINLLKEPWRLKTIIDSLWWASENNPKYLEFKNSLIWVDSSFETYFNDLEKLEAWISLNASDVIKWLEKDSWGMLDIDLKANISKLSLVWSDYSFDKELDKQALSELQNNKEKSEAELKSGFTALKGLYKPFASLLSITWESIWKQDSKEKINNALASFPQEVFSEMVDVYKTMDIDSNIQITQADVSSLANSKTPEEFNLKKQELENKFIQIAKILEAKQEAINKEFSWKVQELVSRNKEAKEKEIEVLKYFKSCGFDLLPKNLTDKIIRNIQAGLLTIPWLDLSIKNIDLEQGHFWENSVFIDKNAWLNIWAKTNLAKFMNKLLSWNIEEPLWVEAIANWTAIANPTILQNKFLESNIATTTWWNYGRMIENLRKKV